MKTYKTNISKISLVREKTDILKAKFSNSQDVADYARNFYHADIDIYESMFIMLLNRNNTITGYAKISQGGTAGTVVDVKIVCKYAIDSLAAAIIMVHNHPSGNTKPSEADKLVTKKVKEGLKLFDISLLDHVILTEESYLSMADEALI